MAQPVPRCAASAAVGVLCMASTQHQMHETGGWKVTSDLSIAWQHASEQEPTWDGPGVIPSWCACNTDAGRDGDAGWPAQDTHPVCCLLVCCRTAAAPCQGCHMGLPVLLLMPWVMHCCCLHCPSHQQACPALLWHCLYTTQSTFKDVLSLLHVGAPKASHAVLVAGK